MSQAAHAVSLDPLTLTDMQLDALGETFSLALGEAASVFAAMLSQEVELSVPHVELLTREALVTRFEAQADRRLCGIQQHFAADTGFRTDAMLVFPEESCLGLVRQMLRQEDISQFTELEQDALAEIGNIIINACMSRLADRLGTEIEGSLPHVLVNEPRKLFKPAGDPSIAAGILVARIDMRIARADVSGFVLFIMDVASIRTFVAQVSRLFGI